MCGRGSTVVGVRPRKGERVGSVVDHPSANSKVPSSIPGPVLYRGHEL